MFVAYKLLKKKFLRGAWDHWYSVYGCSVNLASGEVTEEGALRGDKGAKIDIEVDQSGYLMRAISLARGEAYLLAGAFLCLGLSSISSLILPSYQVFNAITSLVYFVVSILLFLSRCIGPVLRLVFSIFFTVYLL